MPWSIKLKVNKITDNYGYVITHSRELFVTQFRISFSGNVFKVIDNFRMQVQSGSTSTYAQEEIYSIIGYRDIAQNEQETLYFLDNTVTGQFYNTKQVIDGICFCNISFKANRILKVNENLLFRNYYLPTTDVETRATAFNGSQWYVSASTYTKKFSITPYAQVNVNEWIRFQFFYPTTGIIS